ncbi:unnamed protein product [Sphagnum compactum]
MEAKGERASRMVSFIGAIAIADLVKATLGPKGMEVKMVTWHVKIRYIKGYWLAVEAACAVLEHVLDNRSDSERFRSDLSKIAMTTLSSKILAQDKEHFANLAVDAVLWLKVLSIVLVIDLVPTSALSSFQSYATQIGC